jgi:hypothetical protein
MKKISAFLKSRWGTVTVWVLVMYITAFLWNVVDSKGWYAFPTYILAGFIWIGSFLNMLASFIEWTGSGVRLKLFDAAIADKLDETNDVDGV